MEPIIGKIIPAKPLTILSGTFEQRVLSTTLDGQVVKGQRGSSVLPFMAVLVILACFVLLGAMVYNIGVRSGRCDACVTDADCETYCGGTYGN